MFSVVRQYPLRLDDFIFNLNRILLTWGGNLFYLHPANTDELSSVVAKFVAFTGLGEGFGSKLRIQSFPSDQTIMHGDHEPPLRFLR